MKKLSMMLAIAAGISLAAMLFRPQGPAAPTAQRPSPVPDPPPAVDASTLEAPPAAGPTSMTAAKAPGAEAPSRLADGMDPKEAARRRRLLELRRAADQRFAQTVETDGLKPGDVRPEIRRFFRSVTLEPALDVDQPLEGQVVGLRIAELSPASALARAGFRAGDRLVRLDGQPLADPAQIPYTVMALGKHFEVCAERGSGEHCRTVVLGGD